MKMNLLILARNEHLVVQLNKFVEKNKPDDARALLSHYFPSRAIRFANDRIILEMADLLSSIAEDPEPKAYLQSLRRSTQNLIRHYLHNKRLAKEHNAYVNYRCQKDYMAMTREQRAACGYTPMMIKDFLTQLDSRENYHSYMDGYEYEHYQAYEWLLHQIDETLSGQTHNTAVTVRDSALGI